MTDPSVLLELAGRVEALGPNGDNTLDVLCELALFVPDETWLGVRANSAGTKIIYVKTGGQQVTYWAPDWTEAARRPATIAALRALAAREG